MCLFKQIEISSHELTTELMVHVIIHQNFTIIFSMLKSISQSYVCLNNKLFSFACF